MTFLDEAASAIVRAAAERLAPHVGSAIVEEFQRAAGEGWQKLPDAAKVAVPEAAVALAKYHLLTLARVDCQEEILGLESTIKDWSWVGVDLTKKVLLSATLRSLGLVGGSLLRVLL